MYKKLVILSPAFMSIIVLLAWLALGSYVESKYDAGLKAYQDKNFTNTYSIFHSLDNQKQIFGGFHPLAKDKHANIQNRLGIIIANSEGKIGDGEKTAVDWYTLSAKQGYHWGQHNLAQRYSSGKDVEKNLIRSYMWFHISASNGNESAKKKMNEMKKNKDISKLAVEIATYLAQQCKKSNYTDCY